MRTVGTIVAAFVLFAGTAVAGQEERSLYVQSAQARVLAEPRFDAPPVVTVPRGQALVLEEEGDRWHRVRAAGESGWVAALLVAPTPPLPRTSLLEAGPDLEKNARVRASAVVTAGASRGLLDRERERVSRGSDADYAALQALEESGPGDAEVLSFLREVSAP